MASHVSSEVPGFSRSSFGWAISIALLLLSVFYFWFAVADRYAIFLYGHVARGIPESQPFDTMTSSRYWMAGLVAGGMVLVTYTPIQWLLGLRARRRGTGDAPPAWWQVWLLAAFPVAIGVPFITMTVNQPTLPFPLAAACGLATVAGLALALWPGDWAAARPWDLLWLWGDGVGLMPVLLLLRTVELPERGVSVSEELALLMTAGALGLSITWLILMSLCRRWRHRPGPGAGMILVAGCTLTYLLLPLAHYLLATPPKYRYITASSNFFAFDPLLQLLTFGVAVGLALTTVWLRRRFSDVA